MIEFRKAIRYYSENLLGVKHDSYNYKKLVHRLINIDKNEPQNFYAPSFLHPTADPAPCIHKQHSDTGDRSPPRH